MDHKTLELFIDWLRKEGYYLRDREGDLVPTYELLEKYRLAGGMGR